MGRKKIIEVIDCGICGAKMKNKGMFTASCCICELDMCPNCRYISPYTEEERYEKNENLSLNESLEWEIFDDIMESLEVTYPNKICNKCFELRTREILRTYPIDDMGLLVNATLIPLNAIKDRLSTG